MALIANRVGLIGLLLLVGVPFVLPWHTSPIPSFYSEWWAFLFGLMACIGLAGARSLPLPAASWLALALAAVAGLQWLTGHAAVRQLAVLYGLYLLWAALLASASRHLAEQLGSARLIRWLAMALLAGAVSAALLGLAQPWLHSLGWPGFSVRQGGPLGQANHFTTHVWMGLASALYLRVTGRLGRWSFWTLVILLTLAVVLVGQRSSILYAASLVGLAFWLARSLSDGQAVIIRRASLGIGAAFILLQPVVVLAPSLGAGDLNPPPALRASQMAEQPSVRLQLWKVGLVGMIEAPWLGNGIGGFPRLALEHADRIPSEDNPGPAESAHNLFVDMAVELGVPAALLTLGVLLALLWRVKRAPPTLEQGWALAVIVILGLHALLEYPLSYAYFLGLLAVLLAVIDDRRWQIGQRLAPVALSLGLVIWGGLALAEMRRDYRLLELALATGKQPELFTVSRDSLLRIPTNSLLLPWVATTACVSLDPLTVPVEIGLYFCRITQNFSPTNQAGANYVALQWRAGDGEGAKATLSRLSRAMAKKEPNGASLRIEILSARDERLLELIEKK